MGVRRERNEGSSEGRKGGREEGRKMRDEEEKITELNKHLMD